MTGVQTCALPISRLGDACNLFGQPDDVARKVGVLRAACRAAGRDPSAIEVTHLSTIHVLGPEVKARPGRARVRSVEVNSGTIEDHRHRFEALQAVGVDHAIVSLADLTDADGGVAAIERFRPLVAAFANAHT